MKTLLVLFTLILTSFTATADDTQSALELTQIWVRATPPGVTTSAMYMTIGNHNKSALKLIAVTSDITDRIEIHNTTMKDGMMQMRQIDDINIEKMSSAELKPHGKHIMLFDLKAPLEAGTTVSVNFIFDNGKTLSAEVPVMKQAGSPNHSDMKSVKDEHKHKDQ